MKYNIILWGMGRDYNRHVNLIKFYEILGQINIVGVTSNDNIKMHKIDGFNFLRKEELKQQSIDYIIVMNEKFYTDIVEDILKAGFERKQIIPFRVLEIPGFDFDDYVQLKNSNISIIANNCWGGFIYYTLGLECLSPFKNLSVGEGDYIKLLADFSQYMSYSLTFDKFAIDRHSGSKYPVMSLGDIKIKCNHDTDPDEAIEKWNRRAVKINYDNLYVMMYTDNAEIADIFSNLDRYDKKVCFVPFDARHKCQIKLEMWKNMKEFYEAVNTNAGLGTGSIAYNPLKLLLGKECMRYE